MLNQWGRVLVTGASGFIGTHIVQGLAKENTDLHLIVRNLERSHEKVPELTDQAHFYVGDITNEQQTRQLVQEISPDYIFHLAATTDVSRDFMQSSHNAFSNLISTINILQASYEGDVKSIVCTGSAEEYGVCDSPFIESMPFRPASPYAASKSAATIWCQMAAEHYQLPVTILRPFICYGPGQALNRLIPQAIMAAINNTDFSMTKGNQMRDFLFIDDVVDAYLLAAKCKKSQGEIINLGSGNPLSVRDVISTIYRLTNSKGKPLFGSIPSRSSEQFNYHACTKKSFEILGWKSQTSLSNGLIKTIEWYRTHSNVSA